jgi:hypothetical protein
MNGRMTVHNEEERTLTEIATHCLKIIAQHVPGKIKKPLTNSPL